MERRGLPRCHVRAVIGRAVGEHGNDRAVCLRVVVATGARLVLVDADSETRRVVEAVVVLVAGVDGIRRMMDDADGAVVVVDLVDGARFTRYRAVRVHLRRVAPLLVLDRSVDRDGDVRCGWRRAPRPGFVVRHRGRVLPGGAAVVAVDHEPVAVGPEPRGRAVVVPLVAVVVVNARRHWMPGHRYPP